MDYRENDRYFTAGKFQPSADGPYIEAMAGPWTAPRGIRSPPGPPGPGTRDSLRKSRRRTLRRGTGEGPAPVRGGGLAAGIRAPPEKEPLSKNRSSHLSGDGRPEAAPAAGVPSLDSRLQQLDLIGSQPVIHLQKVSDRLRPAHQLAIPRRRNWSGASPSPAWSVSFATRPLRGMPVYAKRKPGTTAYPFSFS